MVNKVTFESQIDVINSVIAKRAHVWKLKAISSIDWEDIAQILRIHIHKKWALYDQNYSLLPWLNRVISHQLRNLIRNHYGAFTRPCLKCSANEGGDLCSIYSKQCSDCPLYKKWEMGKKRAYDTKLPVSIENHLQEVHSIPEDNLDYEKCADKLHSRMKQSLRPFEWRVYSLLFIEHKTDKQVAKIMGFRSTEKNRNRYKRILQIKKNIIKKAKFTLEKYGIEN